MQKITTWLWFGTEADLERAQRAMSAMPKMARIEADEPERAAAA